LAVKQLKYPPEFKAEVCEIAGKENIRSAAIIYGLNEATVGRWYKKFKIDGKEGLITKRKDSQKKKIDRNLLKKILEYKNANPDATLSDIKANFTLDCSLTLIWRHLKQKGNGLNNHDIDKNTYLLTLRTVYHTKFRDEIKSLYQISMHNSKGKIIFCGFTQTRNSRNLCLFILLALKSQKINDKTIKILTKISYINPSEFKVIVQNKYKNITLIKGQIKKPKDTFTDIGLKKSDLTEKVIYYKYKEIILNKNLNSDYKNALIVPLVNIDKYDCTTANEADTHIFPSSTQLTLKKVLDEIKRDGDSSCMDYNFQKAETEYNNAYSALIYSGIKENNLQAELLLRRAELLYNEEEYQSSLMLLKDCAELYKKIESSKGLGAVYYNLGMIYNIYNNRKGAVKYFKRSIKYLSNENGMLEKCLLYRSYTKLYLITKMFNKARLASKNYIKYAQNCGLTELIGNSLTQRGLIFYAEGNYKKSLTYYKTSIDYNIANKNIFDVCDNLLGIISTFTMGVAVNDNEIDEYLAKLKIYSEKAGLKHMQFDAEYRMGIFYYKKNKYALAAKLLNFSAKGNKIFSHKLLYISNLFYLGRAYFENRDFDKAVKTMKILLLESIKSNNSLYTLLANYSILKIYVEKSNLKKIMPVSKIIFRKALRLKQFHIAGYICKALGIVYENRSKIRIANKYYKKALKYFTEFSLTNKTDISEDVDFVRNKLCITEMCK